MTDIVERLRADAEMSRDCSSNWEAFDCSEAMREAADEIERLRLSLSEARATGRREGLEEKVAFTMTDASRMLRKSDIKDVCPHPDDCFYELERARCGPCAVKASKLAGIEIDDTHSHLPEVCRLRREVKAAEARIAELEADHLDERLAMSGRIQFLEDASAVPHLEQRIAELEKCLADAERVIEPFADGRAKTTHANGCRYHCGHDCDCGKDDYLRAARAYMEGKE